MQFKEFVTHLKNINHLLKDYLSLEEAKKLLLGTNLDTQGKSIRGFYRWNQVDWAMIIK